MLQTILNVHYYILQTVQPSIWYDPLLRDLDAQLCKAASAIRNGLEVPEYHLMGGQ